MKEKKAAKKTAPKIKQLIKQAGGKNVLNEIRKQSAKAQEADNKNAAEFKAQKKKFEKDSEQDKNFLTSIVEKYATLPTTTEKEKAVKKLYAKEIDNYNKKRNRELKKIRADYEKELKNIGGAKLADTAPQIKAKIRGLMEEQTKVNNRMRAVRKITGGRAKFELKYNPETDTATDYKVWQQAEFEKDLLNDKYVTNINGLDVKEDMDKIMDLINKMFQQMDSTKLASTRFVKDGHVKIFFADETDIDESENEL